MKFLVEKNAFSLVEILVALIFLSFAFLPLYNLFRFGQVATTSNINEVTATNYASDMINFIRDIPYYKLEQAAGDQRQVALTDDSQIQAFFSRIDMQPPGAVSDYFTRSVEIQKYDGRREGWTPPALLGRLADFIRRRRRVGNYLVRVRVDYQRSAAGGDVNVTLFSIVAN